ncbi:DUF3105 domain-containing protein [Dactylosporangium sp. CS-033363]|uniref:DUF3105 domain-containing protein n=1 Tax=Dactylosporangium sp. CS-033363 TaxID=3239935 RepID=UPI003D8CB4B3
MTGPYPEPPYAPQQPPAAPYAPQEQAPYAPQQPQAPYAPPQYPPPAAYPPPPYMPGPGGPGMPGGPAQPKSNKNLIIILSSVAAVLAILCVAGVVGVFWFVGSRNDSATDDADVSKDIPGVIDYRLTHPDWLGRDHVEDTAKPDYPMVPAAGGNHFGMWQRCAGDVYDKEIPEGRAVHSLEHGAVWITYQPGLARSEVDKLAAKVRNTDFMLMSPYDGQPSAISLQAWGYQLRVDKADDPRVDQFIRKYRQTASLEPGTPCSNGLAE